MVKNKLKYHKSFTDLNLVYTNAKLLKTILQAYIKVMVNLLFTLAMLETMKNDKIKIKQ